MCFQLLSISIIEPNYYCMSGECTIFISFKGDMNSQRLYSVSLEKVSFPLIAEGA